MNHLNIWLEAIRPKTLAASFAPLIVGGAFAMSDGVFKPLPFLLALLGALLLQIGTNLSNDYYDFKKGADTEERVGPRRAAQTGLIPIASLRFGFIICFALAFLIGMYFTTQVGMVAFWITIVSILSGLAYTAGPFPLAYVGLGDLFVLIFFGPVAVVGAYYVQNPVFKWEHFHMGLAIGFLSTAILAVNNLRDIETDKKSNKNTLAVRFGVKFAKWEYLICCITALVIPLYLFLFYQVQMTVLMTWFVLILMIPSLKTVWTEKGPVLNHVLAKTGKILFFYSLLFSFGRIL